MEVMAAVDANRPYMRIAMEYPLHRLFALCCSFEGYGPDTHGRHPWMVQHWIIHTFHDSLSIVREQLSSGRIQ